MPGGSGPCSSKNVRNLMQYVVARFLFFDNLCVMKIMKIAVKTCWIITLVLLGAIATAAVGLIFVGYSRTGQLLMLFTFWPTFLAQQYFFLRTKRL